jgi:peptidoglycan hydrolase CwlO-like protein
MIKEQVKQDIASWEEKVRSAKKEIEELKKFEGINHNQIAATNARIFDYRKIINNLKWRLYK